MTAKSKRKNSMDAPVPLSFTVPQDLIEKLDAMLVRVRNERGGAPMSRADLVRELLYKAIQADLTMREAA